MPQQRHARGMRNVFCVAAVAAASLSLAADLPLKPEQPAAPAAAGPLAPPTATCREWSDGCRTCQRAEGGEVSCSNVGIACVPKQATCTAADAPGR